MMLVSLLLAAVVGSVIYYVVQPQRLAAITEGVLQSILPGSVATIGSVDFAWDGRVKVDGLKLSVKGMQGPGADLFSAEEAVVQLNMTALLRGKVELRRIAVSRPVLSLTQIGPDRFNFDVLREAAQSGAPGAPPESLPKIELIEGRVAFGELEDDRYEPGPSLYLAGAFSADSADNARYRIDFFEYDPASPPAPLGASLKGWFTPRDLGLNVELSNFTVSAVHRRMLPRQVRSWWDQFQPEGRVSLVRVEHDTVKGPQALIQLDDVNLTFAQLSTEDYKARMTGVSARFHFDAQAIRVESLVGEIEDLRYEITGHILGYQPDSAFGFTLETQPFEIPDKPRYMPAFPGAVQNVFRMLTPIGWTRVSIAVERASPGGPVGYKGAATILSGAEVLAALAESGRPLRDADPADPRFSSRGKYRKFPYEVYNCRGLITFDTQAVSIERIEGDTAGGGRLTITGTIAPPSIEPIVDLVIRGTNIPLDDALFAAMPEKQRQATLMFFHEPGWRELLAKKHFVTQAEHASAIEALRDATTEEDRATLELAAKRPVFELGGRCNAIVNVKGLASDEVKPEIQVAIELFDANVVFEHFKYPLKVHRGLLRVDKRRAVLENVAATGLNGGHGRLDGELEMPDRNSGLKTTPRLGLLVREFPIDDLLFDVLGNERADWLRGLRLTGRLDVEGTIFRDREADRIEADMNVLVSQGTAHPGRGQYPLRNIAGRLTVSLRHAAIEHITAEHGEARFSLSGEARWAAGEPPALKVQATGQSLELSDPVLDLVRITSPNSDAVDAFWARWKPSGQFDFTVDYDKSSDNRDYRLDLRPHTLAFDKGPHRVELTETSGMIVVQPSGVALDRFSGRYDGGRLSVGGQIGFTAPRSGDFYASAEGAAFTEAFFRLLPDNVSSVLRATSLQGQYALDIPALRLRPDASAEPSLEIAATLKLSDGSMQLGVPITRFNGQAVVAGVVEPASTFPTMRVVLTASSLLAASKSVTDLTAELSNEGGDEAIRLTRLESKLAGGRLSATGHGRLDRGDYALRLVLTHANLAELASTQDFEPEFDDATDRQPLTGRLSAALDVEGSWRNPDAMRGRGDLIVRGSNVRGLPLSYGLLRITHLALPTNNPFDTASLSYLLTRNKVDFQSIELASPETKLSGRGTMSLPNTDLNIALTTSNVKGLRLGPLTELINKFRDQLVTLHITGTLDKPQVNTRQFYGLAEAWKEIFGEEPAKQPPPPSPIK